jgi:hypothetical protein
VFAITTTKEFLQKVVQDFEALGKKIDDSSLAINCILSSYHLHEWVWTNELKGRSPVTIGSDVIQTKADFVAWLDTHCPHFSLIQELANGTKHCRPVVYGTEQVAGYGRGPYGIGPYGMPYLLIDLGSHLPGDQRYLVASEMLRGVIEFWSKFFEDQKLT